MPDSRDAMPVETIYAPSSGQGQAAVSVIRVSGPDAFPLIERLIASGVPEERRLVVRKLRDADGSVIDEAMIAVFAEGRSFTGEPMAEIHSHGSRAVMDRLGKRIDALEMGRLATPGEFTRRAFLNGRLSLSEAEGLADLIAAETEAQRRQAVRLMQGGLARMADRWRSDLIQALALLEVTIDWVDEEIPQNVVPEVDAILKGLRRDFQDELARAERAEKIRSGFQVALVGAPNVGKSTLLNALAGRDAAITSEIPGTTRDVVEVRCDLDGLAVTFLDTAGVRESVDTVERLGIARALERAATADLRLFLQSADACLPAEAGALRQADDLIVWTKNDVTPGPGDLQISALTGEGVDALMQRLSGRLSGNLATVGLLSHARHRRELEAAEVAISRASAGLGAASVELIVHDLREVLGALEALIGRVGVEDVLDSVFSRFCLGK